MMYYAHLAFGVLVSLLAINFLDINNKLIFILIKMSTKKKYVEIHIGYKILFVFFSITKSTTFSISLESVSC